MDIKQITKIARANVHLSKNSIITTIKTCVYRVKDGCLPATAIKTCVW